MAASTAGAPMTKIGGIAIIAGALLLFIAPFIFLGGALNEPVDPTDFVATVTAMGENPELAHLSTMLTIIGMLLYGLGFLTLLHLPRQKGLGDIALRSGIVSSMFAWGVFITAMGVQHMTINLMQRAANEPPLIQAAYEASAVNLYVVMIGLVFTLMAVFPFGSFLTGLGLASRMKEMSIFKLACYGLMLMAVLGFANFLTLQFADPDADMIFWINNALLWFGAICLIVVGWGMYAGKAELSSEE